MNEEDAKEKKRTSRGGRKTDTSRTTARQNKFWESSALCPKCGQTFYTE